MDDFDDFGIDICPEPEEMFPFSDREVCKKIDFNNEKTHTADVRYNFLQSTIYWCRIAFVNKSGHNSGYLLNYV